MTELSPEARAALTALRHASAEADECERVRRRLTALGVFAGSAAALATSGVAASAGSAAAASAAIGPSAPAAAGGLAAGTGSLAAGGGTLAATGGSTLAAAGGGALATTTLATKLASLPLLVKASVAAAVLAGSVAVPLTMRTPAVPVTSAPRVERAAEQREAARATVQAPKRALERLPSASPGTPAAISKVPSSSSSVAPREPVPSRPKPHVREPAESRRAGKTHAAIGSAAQASRLSAEARLLGDALRAMRSGDDQTALTLLTRHEVEYRGHALLERERERMRAEITSRSR